MGMQKRTAIETLREYNAPGFKSQEELNRLFSELQTFSPEERRRANRQFQREQSGIDTTTLAARPDVQPKQAAQVTRSEAEIVQQIQELNPQANLSTQEAQRLYAALQSADTGDEREQAFHDEWREISEERARREWNLPENVRARELASLDAAIRAQEARIAAQDAAAAGVVDSQRLVEQGFTPEEADRLARVSNELGREAYENTRFAIEAGRYIDQGYTIEEAIALAESVRAGDEARITEVQQSAEARIDALNQNIAQQNVAAWHQARQDYYEELISQGVNADRAWDISGKWAHWSWDGVEGSQAHQEYLASLEGTAPPPQTTAPQYIDDEDEFALEPGGGSGNLYEGLSGRQVEQFEGESPLDPPSFLPDQITHEAQQESIRQSRAQIIQDLIAQDQGSDEDDPGNLVGDTELIAQQSGYDVEGDDPIGFDDPNRIAQDRYQQAIIELANRDTEPGLVDDEVAFEREGGGITGYYDAFDTSPHLVAAGRQGLSGEQVLGQQGYQAITLQNPETGELEEVYVHIPQQGDADDSLGYIEVGPDGRLRLRVHDELPTSQPGDIGVQYGRRDYVNISNNPLTYRDPAIGVARHFAANNLQGLSYVSITPQARAFYGNLAESVRGDDISVRQRGVVLGLHGAGLAYTAGAIGPQLARIPGSIARNIGQLRRAYRVSSETGDALLRGLQQGAIRDFGRGLGTALASPGIATERAALLGASAARRGASFVGSRLESQRLFINAQNTAIRESLRFGASRNSALRDFNRFWRATGDPFVAQALTIQKAAQVRIPGGGAGAVAARPGVSFTPRGTLTGVGRGSVGGAVGVQIAPGVFHTAYGYGDPDLYTEEERRRILALQAQGIATPQSLAFSTPTPVVLPQPSITPSNVPTPINRTFTAPGVQTQPQIRFDPQVQTRTGIRTIPGIGVGTHPQLQVREAPIPFGSTYVPPAGQPQRFRESVGGLYLPQPTTYTPPRTQTQTLFERLRLPGYRPSIGTRPAEVPYIQPFDAPQPQPRRFIDIPGITPPADIPVDIPEIPGDPITPRRPGGDSRGGASIARRIRSRRCWDVVRRNGRSVLIIRTTRGEITHSTYITRGEAMAVGESLGIPRCPKTRR